MANDDFDFDAWEPKEPPRDFAERVSQATRRADRPRAMRVGALVLVGLSAAAAAAIVLLPSRAPADVGEAHATTERAQIVIGSHGRAVVVLEPGAALTWKGDVVTQSKGNVFYRVEPGGAFRVHTAAGEVDVLGTCFRVKVREESEMNARDVKVGAVGALVGVAAFVGVYEGKVALSHASSQGGSRVELAAGESARADVSGVHASGDLANGEKTFDESGARAASGDALLAANANLADSVKSYKDRLAAIESEKQKLAKDLAEAQKKLALANVDGQVPKAKSQWDVTQDEWSELAKDGTVKYRVPCIRPKDWTPKPDTLTGMGLTPNDGAAVKSAFAQSNQRLWSVVKPLCAQAIGSAEVAEKVGPSTCVHLIMDVTQDKDGAGYDEAMRQVGEIRAGQRPMPAPGDAMNPVERMMLAMTGETKSFESDLAQSFGPDDAHRIAYGENGCWQASTFGGPGPRKPPQP
jgi:ferric-dicitrate binding protein FerR (iron transport regulator)